MISIKTEKEIQLMAEAGWLLSKIMRMVEREIKPGVRTRALDALAEKSILEAGAQPAFKGYRGYPSTLCVSINEELVHGVPGWRKIKEGDIVSIDCGLFLNRYYVDMAKTIAVGEVNPESARLIKIVRKALKRGINEIKPGLSLGSLGHTIHSFIDSQGFKTITAMAGHGIGKELHEAPRILNYGIPGEREKLVPGMTFCLEPMASAGSQEIVRKGYYHKTKDDSVTAHFEHTLAVTATGCKILTTDL